MAARSGSHNESHHCVRIGMGRSHSRDDEVGSRHCLEKSWQSITASPSRSYEGIPVKSETWNLPEFWSSAERISLLSMINIARLLWDGHKRSMMRRPSRFSEAAES